mgnify:CR=1 FL=1
MKHRQERVEEEVRNALSEIVLRDVKDPRMPVVFSITRVKMTKDLRIGRVYFTQQPEEDDAIDETLDMLEKARGFLRSMVGQRVTLRYTPELEFYYDEEGRARDRIEELLEKARRESSLGNSDDE